MLTIRASSSGALLVPFVRRFTTSSARLALPDAPWVKSLADTDADDRAEIREWLAAWSKAKTADFPRDALDISYARSSGPGGQHVNKTSTKAILRLPLSPFPTFLPPYVGDALARTPYYAASTHSVLVTSQLSRSQANNTEDAIRKLMDAIGDAAGQGLEGETKAGKKERVEAHIMETIKNMLGKSASEEDNLREAQKSSINEPHQSAEEMGDYQPTNPESGIYHKSELTAVEQAIKGSPGGATANASQADGGAGGERFVGEVPEYLICAVCLDVVLDPQAVCEEEHTFCRAVCFFSSSNASARAELNSVPATQVRCEFEQFGCEWVGGREKSDVHSYSCPFRLVDCSNSDAGCEVVYSLQTFRGICKCQHFSCSNPQCTTTGSRDHITEHRVGCDSIRRDLLAAQTALERLRMELNKFQTE
ncbi:hypothetical protein MNV49_000837 [Pseudohyphozyma bogoriensis]|nr:hypothetical protein MNV49_000837 [Pseudohyphozyma bogoriensis]